MADGKIYHIHIQILAIVTTPFTVLKSENDNIQGQGRVKSANSSMN